MTNMSDNKYVHVFRFNSDLNMNTNNNNMNKEGNDLYLGTGPLPEPLAKSVSTGQDILIG